MALCGALEGKPDFKLKNSVEPYYSHKNNIIHAVRRFVALCGALERKPDFKLKNSVENYLLCKAAL